MSIKKKLTIVLVMGLTLIYLLTSNVFGYSYKTELVPESSSASKGGTVVVKIKLSGIDAGKGIFNYSAILNYDTEVFENVTSNDIVGSTSNGWAVTYSSDTKKILLENTNWVTTDQEIATITFKVKSGATATSATVGLSNITASNESEEIKGTDTSTIISITEAGQIITPEENKIEVIGGNNTIVNEPIVNEVPIAIENNTTSNEDLPYAGSEDYIVPLMAIVVILGVISFINYKKIEE